MEGIRQDKCYNPSNWHYSSTPNTIGTNYSSTLKAEENFKMAKIYNDFLKNDIDFSDPVDPSSTKQEDEFIAQIFDPFRARPELQEQKVREVLNGGKNNFEITFESSANPNPSDNRVPLFGNSFCNMDPDDQFSLYSNRGRRSRISSIHFDKADREELADIHHASSLPRIQPPLYNPNAFLEKVK